MYLGFSDWLFKTLGVMRGSDRFGFAATLGGALAVVRTAHWLKKSLRFSSSDTRKITHTGKSVGGSCSLNRKGDATINCNG
jgi:hypothetical protein